MHKLSIKLLVGIGLIVAGFFVWRQLSGVRKIEQQPAATLKHRRTSAQAPVVVPIAERTADEMKQVITSVLTRVFSRDNLLVANIDENDRNAWEELVDAVQRFVELNYKQEMGDFAVIKKASDQLLATLSETYQYMSQAFVAEKDKAKGLSSFDLKKIDIKKLKAEDIFEKLQVLAPYRDELVRLQASLDRQAQEIKKATFTKKIKREVCEVLGLFAMSVETPINKAFGDTRPLVEQRLADVSQGLFGQDNLLLVDITKRDVKAWENLLGEIKAFVSYNAPAFQGDCTVIADAGTQLIATLQGLYKKMSKAFAFAPDKAQRRAMLDLGKVRATDITSQLRQEMSSYRSQIAKLQQSLVQKIQNFTKDTPTPTKAVGEFVLKFSGVIKDAIEKVVDNTAELFPKFEFAVRRM